MNDVKISVVKQTVFRDLIKKYENPIGHACELSIGDIFISRNGSKPDGLCDEAWICMKKYVCELAEGGGNFFDGWMKDSKTAMISCNDGFRPVSFFIEALENRVIEQDS